MKLGERRVGDEVETILSEHCPWHDVTAFAREVASLHRSYRAGFLFLAGGIADQPAWYIAAMGIAEREVGKHEAEEMERQREQMKA